MKRVTFVRRPNSWWQIGGLALLLLAVLFAGALLWLRFFGLPGALKDKLLAEIEQRHLLPFPITINRLLIDPTGAILAEQVTVFRDATRQSKMLQVDRVRLGLAWLTWWRGNGFINRATIHDAEVLYPIGLTQTADFRAVNADLAIAGPTVTLVNASARLLNLALHLKGTIHNEGRGVSAKPTPAQLAARDRLWLSIVRALGEIGTRQPIGISAEFEIGSRHPTSGRGNFSIAGRELVWRQIPVDRIALDGNLNDGLLTLSNGSLAIERGELKSNGEWNLTQRTAQLQFSSTLDPTRLAPAFSGPLAATLRKLDFSQRPPTATGEVLFDLATGLHANLQADMAWRDFRFNDVSFSHLDLPLAYDGQRLLIHGFQFAGERGALQLDLLVDPNRSGAVLEGKINSTLDPTILHGVFGTGFDTFLKSCAFPAGGPKVEGTVTGATLQPASWSFAGKVDATNFVYKDTAFAAATSRFTFASAQLNLPDLNVRRQEGTATGEVDFDTANRIVRLHDLVTELNVSEVAPVLGPKFTSYTKPYRFSKPPHLRVNGTVDLKAENRHLATDLTVEVQSRSEMQWTLFGIPYVFDRPVGSLFFQDRALAVEMKPGGFYGGTLGGRLEMNLATNPATYALNIHLLGIDFQKFMERTFHYDKSTGTMKMQGHFSGTIGLLRSMTGAGAVDIQDGDITQIPFLGPLTPLIPGFSKADSATGNFQVKEGLVLTQDLDISSLTFALIGTGDYDFVADALNLDMRANAKSLPGLVLFPISKIFEYHGSGSMKHPLWQPRNF